MLSIQFHLAAATTAHIKPTMYHHMTTPTATTATTATTAIVETPLDSRGQPVATEHAIPTSTQSYLSLAIGKNQLPQYWHRILGFNCVIN